MDRSSSFAVLGHVRGGREGPNPKLAELLDEVRRLRPAFVVLTGDMIWGDTDHNPADTTVVLREWNHLDSALATLGVPAYRAPGNHDIQDVATRDIYWRRYGKLPQVVVIGKTRLMLLSSTWIPVDGDTAKMLHLRGVDLDDSQLAWLRDQLARPGFDHTFVFMHHLLWWQAPTGAWWRDVHPLLAAAKVEAVFSGEYGPLKFSTTTKDGVRYFQTSIEGTPSLDMLRAREASRLLSSQFDNFLEVRLGGPRTDVRVHTVAELSSGVFTPMQFAAVSEPLRPAPLTERLKEQFGSPRRLAVLAAGMLAIFSLGWFARGAVMRNQGRAR